MMILPDLARLPLCPIVFMVWLNLPRPYKHGVGREGLGFGVQGLGFRVQD